MQKYIRPEFIFPMIGNYYGGLGVHSKDGQYLWGIEDWDGTVTQEIPEYLYAALKQFYEESSKDTK